MKKPLMLMIMDGFGFAPAEVDNAIVPPILRIWISFSLKIL